MHIKIQFVPHREHNVLPLVRPVGGNCVGKLFPFVVGTVQNTQAHCVGKMQRF